MTRLRSGKRIGSPHVHGSDGHESPLPPKECEQEDKELPKKRCGKVQGGWASSASRKCTVSLYIIFAYVYSMDLLNLARTCKYLRGVLMHKSLRFLRTGALNRIEDFPACPVDLTEPEYTNLVFSTIAMAAVGLFILFIGTCAEGIAQIVELNVICARFTTELWVDREQGDSSVRGYRSSSDEIGFLKEKEEQYKAIHLHARECAIWQQKRGRVYRFDLDVLREERRTSIFERLKQCGYGLEIAYFLDQLIIKSN